MERVAVDWEEVAMVAVGTAVAALEPCLGHMAAGTAAAAAAAAAAASAVASAAAMGVWKGAEAEVAWAASEGDCSERVETGVEVGAEAERVEVLEEAGTVEAGVD